MTHKIHDGCDNGSDTVDGDLRSLPKVPVYVTYLDADAPLACPGIGNERNANLFISRNFDFDVLLIATISLDL
jgi:hypothetical protein